MKRLIIIWCSLTVKMALPPCHNCDFSSMNISHVLLIARCYRTPFSLSCNAAVLATSDEPMGSRGKLDHTQHIHGPYQVVAYTQTLAGSIYMDLSRQHIHGPYQVVAYTWFLAGSIYMDLCRQHIRGPLIEEHGFVNMCVRWDWNDTFLLASQNTFGHFHKRK